MIQAVLRFVRDHTSLTLIVVGGFLSLIVPFLIFPVTSFLFLPEAFWSRPAIGSALSASIAIGGAMLLAGIGLGLCQGIRKRGRIS